MPEVKQEIREVSEANAFIEATSDFKIATQDDYVNSSAKLKQVKDMKKAVEEKRKEMTAPLDNSKKKIMDFFRPVVERLDKITAKINSEMNSFRRIQEEEARKKQEVLARETKEDDIFTPTVEAEIPKVETKVRTAYKFKVKDKSKLKSDFLIPDDKAIGEFVRKFKEEVHKWVGEGAIEIYTEQTNF